MSVFETINNKLANDSNIDIAFSGSTAVGVCFYRNSLFCANVGDSRAIVAKKTAEKWTVIPLSRDHKPSDRDETKRIL
jgi:serine/threonine protein phosphatase PrpC